MKKAFAEQGQELCFSTLNLLPTADSKNNCVEIGSSGVLPLLTREELCADSWYNRNTNKLVSELVFYILGFLLYYRL